MNLLASSFALGVVGLWASSFGYLAGLGVIAWLRRRPQRVTGGTPNVAVVIPTLNEAAFITSKLTDLQRTTYPHGRLRIVVVDGGSTDGTVDLVRTAAIADHRIELECLSGAPGQAAQVQHVLNRVPEEFVVVSDADGRLAPTCIAALVDVLGTDPATVVVGAMVEPETPCLEERMHWWLVNHLWWLEGEALSAAMVSGVCYAVRGSLAREGGARVPGAMDLNLAMAAAARGGRVRICREARAIEVRAPRRAGELLRYRRRRGQGYLAELRHAIPTGAPLGWRLARLVRLWHFRVTPLLGAAVAGLGLVLLLNGHWRWPVGTLAGFAAPLFGVLWASVGRVDAERPWWHYPLAAVRWLGLTWVALALVLTARTSPSGSGSTEG